MNSISVSCDTDGAWAVITYLDDNNNVNILGSAVVENDIADIEFIEPVIVPMNLTLCVTGRDKVTYITDIPAMPDKQPYLVLKSYNLPEKAVLGKTIPVNFQLENVAYNPYIANNVVVNVTTESKYITISELPLMIGSIASETVYNSENQLLVTIAENVPDNEEIVLNLTISCEYEGKTYSWQADIRFFAFAPSLFISETFLENKDGVRIDQINQNVDNIIVVRFKNSGHADLENLNVAVSLVSQYLNIENNSDNIELIQSGRTIDVRFLIRQLASAPAGTPVNIAIRASSGVLTDEKVLVFTIGKPVNYLMANGTIPTSYCNFYDSGGIDNNYKPNENYKITFYPQSTGKKLKISFKTFDVEDTHDYLSIYDGLDTSDDFLLAQLSGSQLPQDYEATNDSGALTFAFISNASVQKAGWSATIYEFENYYNVSFDINDAANNRITDATIIFDGYKLAKNQMEMSLVMPGYYNYSVEKEGYNIIEGGVNVIDEDEKVKITLTIVSIDNNLISNINLYPNPFEDIIYLNGKFSLIKKVYINNMLGQMIKEINLEGKSSFSTENLPKGVYLMILEGFDKKTETLKMLKK
jgi:hypothetical protein